MYLQNALLWAGRAGLSFSQCLPDRSAATFPVTTASPEKWGHFSFCLLPMLQSCGGKKTETRVGTPRKVTIISFCLEDFSIISLNCLKQQNSLR